MNSINSNNQPIYGTPTRWGKIGLVYFVVLILGIMASKSCNDTGEQPHLFISKQTTR